MDGNFPNCFTLTLEHEGGFVNNPKDPGGATNYGITQGTYDQYRRLRGDPKKPVKYISRGEVADIYKSMYWSPIKGDDLPLGVDYTTYDAGVNSGPSQGAKWTQKAVGVKADGKVGPQTLAALADADDVTVIKKACAARLGFMKVIRHKKTGERLWDTFGRGWGRRVAEVEAGSIAMAAGTHVVRDEAEKGVKRMQKEAAGTTASGVGTAGGAAALIPSAPVWFWWALIAVGVVLLGITMVRLISALDRRQMMLKVADLVDKLEGGLR